MGNDPAATVAEAIKARGKFVFIHCCGKVQQQVHEMVSARIGAKKIR